MQKKKLLGIRTRPIYGYYTDIAILDKVLSSISDFVIFFGF